ncbi:MAG: hypothetical protein JST30_14655 [Armatimonadetes bacterium]|nr:hypothetical protein [Armatimonadota bacterium]
MRVAAALFVTTLAATSNAATLYSYKVYRLEPPAGATSFVPLNFARDGRIVGYAVLDGGHRSVAGTLENGLSYLSDFSWHPDSACFGGSVSGRLAGETYDAFGRLSTIAWNLDGTLVQVGIPSGANYSTAVGCDTAGRVALGAASGDQRTERPYLWTEGTGFEVRQPASGTNAAWPADVLGDGTIVGVSRRYVGGALNEERATLRSPTGTVVSLPHPSGTTHSLALSARDPDLVVGFAEISGRTRATVWVSGVVKLLPDTGSPSIARAAGANGDVFGEAGGSSTVWLGGTGRKDMNTLLDFRTPGWSLQTVRGVAPDGTVLGTGTFEGTPDTPFVARPVYGLDVYPSSATVNLGWLSQGDAYSLTKVDNDVFRVCRFLVPNQQAPQIQVTVSGFLPLTNVSRMTLESCSRAMSSGMFAQCIELFNFETGTYDLTDVRTDALGRSWSYLELEATGTLRRLVRDDNLMRARYSVRAVGPTAIPGWCVEHDMVRWHVQ